MRILAIPDLHLPYAHPGALAFCRDLRDKCRCDKVVLLGDVPDFTALSRFDKLPEAPSAHDELRAFQTAVRPWYRTFPDAKCIIGNHEARLLKRSSETGIPSSFIRPLNEILGTPKWRWEEHYILDDVLFTHGLGAGGKYHAVNIMDKMLCSVVVGHIHTVAMLYWKANYNRRIFGMDCGCLVDDKSVAFAYARTNIAKSILAAGTIIDGIPQLHIMPMARGEKYHASKFRNR
jgi:predicted phosphodiesterase